jgi:hypothetical protein
MAGGRGQALMNTDGFMKADSPRVPAGGRSYFAVQGGTSGPDPDLGWSWTVIPSKIPHGGQFVISAVPGSIPAADLQAVWEFAKTSAPISCAKLVKPGQRP